MRKILRIVTNLSCPWLQDLLKKTSPCGRSPSLCVFCACDCNLLHVDDSMWKTSVIIDYGRGHTLLLFLIRNYILFFWHQNDLSSDTNHPFLAMICKKNSDLVVLRFLGCICSTTSAPILRDHWASPRNLSQALPFYVPPLVSRFPPVIASEFFKVIEFTRIPKFTQGFCFYNSHVLAGDS